MMSQTLYDPNAPLIQPMAPLDGMNGPGGLPPVVPQLPAGLMVMPPTAKVVVAPAGDGQAAGASAPAPRPAVMPPAKVEDAGRYQLGDSAPFSVDFSTMGGDLGLAKLPSVLPQDASWNKPSNATGAPRLNELGDPLPALGGSDNGGGGLKPLPPVIPPKGMLAGDQAELQRVQSTGSGISQIKNPFLRTLAQVGDAVGSSLMPALAINLPGTAYHHAVDLGNARRAVANDEQQLQAGSQLAETRARTRLLGDQANAAEAPASPEYDYVDTPEGKVAIQKGTTTAQPVLLNGKPIAPPVKAPTSPFELWLKQNPNGTAEQFAATQTRPLSQDEADALNNVWDGIAAKHHLPTGQFSAGMPRADATTLAGSMNNAIGKQQGDTHVSISLAGLNDRRQAAQVKAKASGPLDMADPGNQAAVQAVANGDAKLGDVFGRGTTMEQKAQFLAAVRAVKPDYNSGDHDLELASRKYFISGQGGAALNAMQTAGHHLDLLDAAGTALNNGDVRTLNAIGNTLGYQMGSDAQSNFQLIRDGLAAEVARAYTGGVPNEGEIDDFRKNLGTDNSPKGIHNGIATVRGMLAGKMKSLQDQAAAGSRAQANFPGAQQSPAAAPSGMAVSLSDAMALPQNKGKTADQVKADIVAHGHQVRP